MVKSKEQVNILLVEDNDDDVFIFMRNCRKVGVDHPVQVVADGRAAICYLSGEGEYADREKHPFPDIILLDLKLPLHSGLDVLTWIRNQPKYDAIPVVLLTASAELRDIARARRLRANAYFVKPPSREALRSLFSQVVMPAAKNASFIVEGNRLTPTFSQQPFA